LNIDILTLTEVEQVEGEVGGFVVTLRESPRYVDTEKCIACGECARVCPMEIEVESHGGVGVRKAIYLKYPQAVPLKYQIDPQGCIHLQGGRCGACEKACPTGAIRFHDTCRTNSLEVGSIILAPGFRTFNPTGIRTWGYGLFPHVIRSMDLERMLSASGPTGGRLLRPGDGKKVRKIAFLQCVGSRDYNKASHGYCSSVCCMSALKEALVAKEQDKDLEVCIFFLDMRTYGKDFERTYERAKEKGIRFHRCRVHSLEPSEKNDGITFRYITDQGKQAEATFDLVVLSVGMEAHSGCRSLAERTGVELNHNGFAVTSSFAPTATSRPGIYACGTFSGPKDIPQSVVEGSAAAAAATMALMDVRYSLTRQKDFPIEEDVSVEEPRIGVFICHCGSNIAGVVDVVDVADYAAGLPSVVHVERNLFTCSQDSQDAMRRRIREKSLNRVVVVACTPRTHEPLFRETLKASGLNENLFEMANIRNQGAWVHAACPQAATAKAKDLVRMATAKAGLLEALPPVSVGVIPQALVIGGGVAGMVAALGLADQGFSVHLVEKSSQLGGNARHLSRTWKNESIPDFVEQCIHRIKDHEFISVHLKSAVTHAEGAMGHFRSTVQKHAGSTTVDHGVAIIATGGQAYKSDAYGYEHSQKVLTALEFDKLHLVGDERVRYGRNFVFIQCVGSREPKRPYCSKVCCTHSIQSAIVLKEENPARNVYILYRDIRAYGQREEIYKRARELGVVFIDYELHERPNVLIQDDEVSVVVWDHVLHEPLRIHADVVILATAIVSNPDITDLARLYKIPVDADGFVQEAHAKLRPVDFDTDGLFLAGLAHYPKPIEESVVQAQAAVARAVTVLSNGRILLDSIKARVNPTTCDGCALCVDVCPYHAITLEDVPGEGDRKIIAVQTARCKGCGACQSTCPKDGVEVGGFTYRQLSAQVDAALNANV
jgi:heterodisulfide reductase subunit A